MVVFDTLIGNTDRHSQNWGITRLPDGQTILAPAYDNSSSLGREFNSNLAKVQDRLHDANLFKKYCHSSKGSYFIGWKERYRIPHLEYIKLVLDGYRALVVPHIQKLRKLTPKVITDIVCRMPEEIMRPELKEFVIRFLNYRKAFILDLIK